MVDPKDIDFYSLGFNFIETKTMFMATHKNGKWNEGELMPFGNFEISPASCVINYGQGIFEGMKALKGKNGEITLFRPKENAKRFNFSARRMLMPEYDVDKFVDTVKRVVKENEEYIPPYDSGGALYIRPILFGYGPILGVHSAEEFKLIIFTVPVGPYFPEGFKGINLEISKKYTRAAPGGTGSAKTICNYAGTMLPAKESKARGFAQILYLDAIHMEYIEEVGAANFFAMINGKLATPRKSGTILEGITRESILELASKKLGIEIEERDMSYKELYDESCTEVFCAGTAAVITPIASVTLEGKERIFNNREPGEITNKVYKLLTGIQRLDIEDEFGWIIKV
ncbi:MAG: branched chain amino acid aminotransferase [Promethearchaeota archaeon Loki_b32]|nr:branched-chain amino acid aminotransferase [Candidatus Lokiarchaeota archaeon]MCK4479279.1 branched-chain amino acid aminotransferase [Candidatus Lokiarchaeota archaeon]TKJ22506.1 MAG: branched chain amino acid aminotransferase [Candidatus Lokiarchaeota archaeon Loki_b32]